MDSQNQKKLKKPLDKQHKMCYNVREVKRAEIWLSSQTEKKFQRNLKFPLDKRHKMCYNEYVIKRGTSTAKATKDRGNRHEAN